MDLREVIIALCSAHGVSGSEESAAAVAERYLSAFARIQTDTNGNLYATFGYPEAKKNILLDAHLDRIGLIVTDINEKGFAKVDKCGGMDVRVLQNAVLVTEGGLCGTVCCLPPHLSDGNENKATPMDKVWIDFGLPYEEVVRHVRIGEKLTYFEKPVQLLNGKISAPALDNRCGVAALIKVAEMLSGETLPYQVTILLSAQEETYGSGSMTGTFRVEPDEAIVVDVSFAAQPDISGVYAGIGLQKGTMIGISPILNKKMTEKLLALAQSKAIPFQYEVMSGRTGTNADHIAITKGGFKTAMLSIPERYMHTQAEVIHPDDVAATADLIAAYIRSGGAFHD